MRRYQLLATIEMTARCNLTAHSISGLHEMFSFRRYGRNNYPNTPSAVATSATTTTLNSSASSVSSGASPMPLRFSNIIASNSNTNAATPLHLLVDDVNAMRTYSPTNAAGSNAGSLGVGSSYAPPNVVGFGNSALPFASAASAYVPLNSSATSVYTPPNSGFVSQHLVAATSAGNVAAAVAAAAAASASPSTSSSSSASATASLFVPSASSISNTSSSATPLNHSSSSNSSNSSNNNHNSNHNNSSSGSNTSHHSGSSHPKRGCTSCGATNGIHTGTNSARARHTRCDR
jgi:hypothetical protein